MNNTNKIIGWVEPKPVSGRHTGSHVWKQARLSGNFRPKILQLSIWAMFKHGLPGSWGK